MTTAGTALAEIVLKNFAVPDRPLYLVGIFERGVTVYSQQIRAFNLIWALVEKGELPCDANLEAYFQPNAPVSPLSVVVLPVSQPPPDCSRRAFRPILRYSSNAIRFYRFSMVATRAGCIPAYTIGQRMEAILLPSQCCLF